LWNNNGKDLPNIQQVILKIDFELLMTPGNIYDALLPNFFFYEL